MTPRLLSHLLSQDFIYNNNVTIAYFNGLLIWTISIVYLHSIILHVVVVCTHKQNVDHDTEGDEELREGVKHNDGQHLWKVVKEKIRDAFRWVL